VFREEEGIRNGTRSEEFLVGNVECINLIERYSTKFITNFTARVFLLASLKSFNRFSFEGSKWRILECIVLWNLSYFCWGKPSFIRALATKKVFIDLNAIYSRQNFICGLEKLFKRIVIRLIFLFLAREFKSMSS